MKPFGLRPFVLDFVYCKGVGCRRSQRRSRWGKPCVSEWYDDRIVRPRRGNDNRKAIEGSMKEGEQ